MKVLSTAGALALFPAAYVIALVRTLAEPIAELEPRVESMPEWGRIDELNRARFGRTFV